MAPVNLDSKSLDQLERLVATEVDHRLAWTHPEAYAAQVKGVVDTVLNRVASGKWGDSVASVANAKNQFSAINGPKTSKYTVYGNVDSVPDSAVPAFMKNLVSSWVHERALGAPDTVNGGLNYANPKFSDASNMGWINALDGPKLGYGDSTHVHGTVKGLTPVQGTVSTGPDGAPYPADKPAIVQAQQSARSADYSYLPMQPSGGSPALQAARARLTAARAGMASGATSMTPNIDGSTNQPLPKSAYVDARRSLFSNQPIAETGLAGETMNRGGSFAPLTLPNLPDGMVTAPNPAPYSPTMPTGGPGTFAVGSNAAQGAVPLPRPRPDTPATAEVAPVPLPRDARPSSQPAATPAAKQYTTINGKQFEVGSLHKLGNDTWKVIVGPDGKGKTEKVNFDILDEATKNTMAGGVVRDVWGNAVSGAKESVAAAVAPALADVGTKASEMAGQAGSFLSNLFGGKPANANTPTTVTNTVKPAALTGGRSIESRDEALSGASLTPYGNSAWGASLVPAPKATVTNPGSALAAPGAGLTAAQKNAMTSVTKYRQVVNPAYTAFMAASGSGTQGLSPDERDVANAQKATLMKGAAGTGIAAKAPPQYIQQAYTVEVPAAAPALSPSFVRPTSANPGSMPVAQPKIYSSGGYLFASDGKGGTKNIGRDATFANREAGSRGTAAGSDNNSRFETTAIQRANYDRQGIAY